MPHDLFGGHDEETGNAIGQTLYDLNGQFLGILRQTPVGPGPRPPGIGEFYIEQGGGRFIPFRGGQFLTAFGGQVNQGLVLDPQGNITDTISNAQVRRLLGGGGGGGGSRALSLAEQQQLLEQQQQFQIEQQQAGQTFTTGEREESQLFQAAEASKARENAQRLALQGEINNLIGQAVGIRQRSRELLAQTLGQDPFRSGALLRGQVQRGTTPTQAFRSRLHQTSEFEAPQVDFQAPISTLQGQAQDIRDFVTTGLPGQPAFGGPGLARGGVIDTEKGGVRKFGETGQSILVGEQGPEVMTLSKGKVTITPLVGGAAHGGSFSQSDLNPDPSSFIQALSPALGAAGFQDAPIFSRDRSGFLNPARRAFPSGLDLQGIADFASNRPADFGATALQRLNVQPRLVRSSATGRIYFRGDDGQFRLIPDMAAFRRFEFNPEDVVTLSREEARGLGLPESSGTLTERGSIEESTSFGPFSSPLLAPIGENRFVGLPDPASFIRTFGRLDRASQLGILSGFGTAGVGLEDFFERQDFFTPSGSARAGRTSSLN